MENPALFFGNKQTAIAPVDSPERLEQGRSAVKQFAVQNDFKTMVFPLQTHGIQGLVIDAENSQLMQSFEHEADWIITSVPGVAVGVLTADCVPLLVYDSVQRAVGAIHAGWRGAVDGVVVEALSGMEDAFGSHCADLKVFVGPHARTCCYEVDEPFYDTVMRKKFGRNAWHRKDNKLFFDLYACCVEQLQKKGVPKDAITDVGICTICTPTYSSYRREKKTALRNMSWIVLR